MRTRSRLKYLLSAAVATGATAALVGTAAPASAMLPTHTFTPEYFAGLSAASVMSVATLPHGWQNTGAQFFEVTKREQFHVIDFFPHWGPTDWQYLSRIPTLHEGSPDSAKYVLLGAPILPDEFWLGIESVEVFNGRIGENRRPVTDPNVTSESEHLDLLPDWVYATSQMTIPGIPGTVSVGVTRPVPPGAPI